MKAKVTIKDVAREAGVSVATVSYVINNRTDMRISEDTRKKVLQVINLLNYTPNQSAQALVTNRNHTVALYTSDASSVLKKAEQMHLIDSLSDYLHQKNYDLIYLANSYTEKYDNADVIIGYDIACDYFHQVGDRNFRPFLALDCIIHDPLFFEINTDYAKVAEKANDFFQGASYTFVALDTPNTAKKAFIEQQFEKVIYVNDLHELFSLSKEAVATVDTAVYEALLSMKHPENIAPDSTTATLFYQSAIVPAKFDTLFTCIEHAIKRTQLKDHQFLVDLFH